METYGAPGQGRSVHISVITALALIILWYVVTDVNRHHAATLFLPSPFAVIDKFILTQVDGYGGATLLEHTAWSMWRVFSAFFLASVTAIPIGIMMGVSRYIRGAFDPPIEFYRPIPPLGLLTVGDYLVRDRRGCKNPSNLFGYFRSHGPQCTGWSAFSCH